MPIRRSMTIIRRDGELALVNAVRVDDEVEKEIEKLGKIKHIVRIACGHGSDDPYYITKYRTRVWANLQAFWESRFEAHGKIEVTDDLCKGCPAPFDDIQVIEMEQHRKHQKDVIRLNGEFLLLYKASGKGNSKNILISGDLIQNYSCCCDKEKVSSLPQEGVFTRSVSYMLGFVGRVTTPPMYVSNHSATGKMSSLQADVERILAMDWAHLVPPHGPLALDTAKDDWISCLRQPRLLGPEWHPGKGKKRMSSGGGAGAHFKSSPKKQRGFGGSYVGP